MPKLTDQQIFDRIAKVQNTIIKHSAYKVAEDTINRTLKMKLSSGVTKHHLCLSDSGAGKSTLIKQIRKSFPPVSTDDMLIQHVVCVTVPSKPTIKNMAEAILIVLQDPFYYRGCAMQKTQRIYKLAKKKAVKMFVFDEIQHFVEHCSERGANEVADWLKTVMDSTLACFILVGLHRSRQLLLINEQFQRRFSKKLNLPPFKIKDSKGLSDFTGVVKQIIEQFDYFGPVKLTRSNITQIHYATYGIMDYVIRLITAAFDIAVVTNKREFDNEILSKAFLDVIWDDSPAEHNPFDPKFIPGHLNKAGMPFYCATHDQNGTRSLAGSVA
jgi:predicted AAA+ superfamily ATPase